MTQRALILAVNFLWIGIVRAGGSAPDSSPFAIAGVHFEENVTDHDFEVVFEVKGGNEGLTKLTVAAPDGRTVVDFTSPDATALGMRQFRFESPEPKDFNSLTSAYPEGEYTFSGTTATGKRLQSKSKLSHKLPGATSLVSPKASAENVSIKNQVISWTPVKNAVAYMVYVEQDELKVEISAKLPGTASTLAVPNGFLRPATEYTLGIGTVTDGGNVSFIETSFVTSEKK